MQMVKLLESCLYSIEILILVKSQKVDEYFTCVSPIELNLTEGTEYEKRYVKSFDELNVLTARFGKVQIPL